MWFSLLHLFNHFHNVWFMCSGLLFKCSRDMFRLFELPHLWLFRELYVVLLWLLFVGDNMPPLCQLNKPLFGMLGFRLSFLLSKLWVDINLYLRVYQQKWQLYCLLSQHYWLPSLQCGVLFGWGPVFSMWIKLLKMHEPNRMRALSSSFLSWSC